MKQIVTLGLRNDIAGQGHFGAPRGDRTHNGVDYHCVPEMPVLAPVSGAVTKLGFPYGDDLQWRYVEITNGGFRYRVFYVEPSVGLDDHVEMGDVIGVAQDIAQRYPGQGMLSHVHLEVMDANGDFHDPSTMFG